MQLLFEGEGFLEVLLAIMPEGVVVVMAVGAEFNEDAKLSKSEAFQLIINFVLLHLLRNAKFKLT